ncbi:MAG TPA: response regulator [Terriglobia bacterium]|nr:response regulator [Terriglobia bacterium]
MRNKKVLLVDDSTTALLMEQMILRNRADFELIVARDGQEAVEKTLAELPDLIVMDVVMPRMTGIEACKQIRSQDHTRHIPIILVTTRGEPENVEIGYASGCNDYVTKPINGAELITKIEDLMSAGEETTR